MDFVAVLEDKLGVDENKNSIGMQPSDVIITCADVVELERAICFKPVIGIEEGLGRFID